MSIRAMIFDLYGTLVENFSKSGYRDNLTQMAKILSISPEDFRKRWRDMYVQRVLGFYQSPEDCISSALKHFGISATDSQIRQAGKLRWDFVRASLQPRKDAITTLRAIKAAGLKIALLSDCSTEIPRLWNETEFAGIFDVTTFSSTEFVKKPDPKIYFRTAENLGVEPNECIYVGDGGSFELTGAQRVGMHPIRIKVPYETEDSMRLDEDPWTGTTILYLGELIQYIDELVVG